MRKLLAILLCVCLTGTAWAGGVSTIHLTRLGGVLRGTYLPPTVKGLTSFDQAKIGILLQRSIVSPDLGVAPLVETPAPQRVVEAFKHVLDDIPVQDLQSMPLRDLDAAARLIMDRIQGTAPIGRLLTDFRGGTSAPYGAVAGHVFRLRSTGRQGLKRFIPRSHGRQVYLLPRPLEATVALGPVARFLHYFLETAFQFGKAAAVWYGTDSLAAGLSLLAFELVKLPPMISLQGLMDLELRYAWARERSLKDLARLPGVRRIRVLNGGQTEFKGLLPVRKSNRGLVFLETTRPLHETGLGTAILVDDLTSRRLRLSLGETAWEPTLAALLAGEPIPKEVADAWRAHIAKSREGKTWYERLFTGEMDFPIQAELLEPLGGSTSLGVLTQGKATEKLLKLRLRDRLFARGGERSVPLLESRVLKTVRGVRALIGRLLGRVTAT